MFCRNCGAQVADGAATCAGCGASLASLGAANPSVLVADRAKAACADAWQALRVFASDPVGRLPTAFEALGPARAVGAGITFGLASALALLIGIFRALPPFVRPPGPGGFVKLLLVATVPVIALFAATAAARAALRAGGTPGHDSFIAGASSLPFGAVALLAAVLGVGNLEVISVAALFAACLTVLMLFTGLTRICQASARAATVAVPLMLIATAWLSKIIYTAMLEHAI